MRVRSVLNPIHLALPALVASSLVVPLAASAADTASACPRAEGRGLLALHPDLLAARTSALRRLDAARRQQGAMTLTLTATRQFPLVPRQSAGDDT